MPRPACLIALLVATAAALLGPAAPAAGAGWLRPVKGSAARGFDLGPNPFEGGRHRGVDLVASPGDPVRSACPGRVAFAGRVADAGLVVSVVCGRWRVSYLPLRALAVRKGARVGRGTRLGAAGSAAGHRGLHVGVRREGDRFGYVDPLRFFTGLRQPPITAAPRLRPPRPPGGLPHRIRRIPIRRPAPRPLPGLSRLPHGAPAPAGLPHGAPAPVPLPLGARSPVRPPPGARSPVRRPHESPPASGPGRPAPAPGALPTAHPSPSGLLLAPWPAWLGLGLVLAGAFGARAQRVRRRRAASIGHVARTRRTASRA